MPSGLCYLNSLNRSICIRNGVYYYYSIYCLIGSPVFNANIVDLDQTPQNAASDLGLQCFPYVPFNKGFI